MLGNIWRDLRFALRSFAAQRGFTAAVTVSIALGIAANTTVFSMVNALLLGDLPVRDAGSLVAFSDGFSFSWADYVDYRDQTKAIFEGVSAHFPLVPASIGGSGEPERVWGQLADGAYFSLAGIPMELGRGIVPDEDRAAGASQVVVLSDGLWRRRFDADTGIVGRSVLLNSARYTVIGVTAPGFHGTERGLIGEFWAPLAMAAQLMPDLHPDEMRPQRNSHWLSLMARLKPGVSRQQAVTVLNTIQKRLDLQYRKGETPSRPITLAKAGGLLGGPQTVMGVAVVLMAVVGLVLLIACVNVAGLMLARATTRQREIGVRLAIGAGRGRLVRQLLTESLVLAVMGAIMGLALAAAAVRAIAGFRLPLPFPLGLDFRIDLRVGLFTAAIAMLAGIAFGLAPALRATSTNLVSALKNESPALGPGRRFGVRGILVLVQVSLSLVLLVEAGLFLRSLENASSIDLGMRPDGVAMMAVDPKLHHYTPEQYRQFVAQLRDRVSAIPGVTSVSFVDSLPLSIGGTNNGLKPRSGKEASADIYTVGSNYFATLGIPLLRGRDFDIRRDSAATIIVNEELARKMFPGEDPLGQQVEYEGAPGLGKQMYQVIGVVKNSKSRTLGEGATNMAYLFLEPKPEQAISFYGITVLARSSSASGPMLAAMRRAIHSLDPNLPIFNAETMRKHVDQSMLLPRLCATLLGIFGLVGAVLATVGLYGVMSFSTRARTREIGIRMALGAHPRGVLRLITLQGMALLAVGLAIGLGLSLAVARLTASLLYGVSATDAATFAAVPVLMIAAGTLAVLIPARRAARIEPLNALRYE